MTILNHLATRQAPTACFQHLVNQNDAKSYLIRLQRKLMCIAPEIIYVCI